MAGALARRRKLNHQLVHQQEKESAAANGGPTPTDNDINTVEDSPAAPPSSPVGNESTTPIETTTTSGAVSPTETAVTATTVAEADTNTLSSSITSSGTITPTATNVTIEAANPSSAAAGPKRFTPTKQGRAPKQTLTPKEAGRNNQSPASKLVPAPKPKTNPWNFPKPTFAFPPLNPPTSPTIDATTPKKPSFPKTAPPKPTAPAKQFDFPTLPKELQLQILTHTLTHPTPIPIHPTFKRSHPIAPPCADYRILHTCTALYNEGLPIYYGLNTFSMDLRPFTAEWGRYTDYPDEKYLGLGFAREGVRKLMVHTRDGGHWSMLVRAARGFDNLETLVVDLRGGWGVECGDDGGVIMEGAWSKRLGKRGKQLIEGRYDIGYVEVGRETQLWGLLERAGVKVKSGVWVGHYADSLGRAKRWVEKSGVTYVLSAFERMEELRGCREEVKSVKEWEAEMAEMPDAEEPWW